MAFSTLAPISQVHASENPCATCNPAVNRGMTTIRDNGIHNTVNNCSYNLDHWMAHIQTTHGTSLNFIPTSFSLTLILFFAYIPCILTLPDLHRHITFYLVKSSGNECFSLALEAQSKIRPCHPLTLAFWS